MNIEYTTLFGIHLLVSKLNGQHLLAESFVTQIK